MPEYDRPVVLNPEAVGDPGQTPIVKLPPAMVALFERPRCPECRLINRCHQPGCSLATSSDAATGKGYDDPAVLTQAELPCITEGDPAFCPGCQRDVMPVGACGLGRLPSSDQIGRACDVCRGYPDHTPTCPTRLAHGGTR